MGFTLVTNRVSDNLSNIGVLLTACVFGGTTASLSGVLLRVVMYFTFNRSQIIIERKDVDDGQIEVSTYVTSQFVQGIDFTKRVLPPLISLDKGMLFIKLNQPLNLDYRQFQNDFILDQFNSDQSKHRNNSSMNILMGWKAIYIRVPKSMAIDKGNNNIEIIVQ